MADIPSKPVMHDLLTAFGQAYHNLLTEGAEHAPAVEAAEAAIVARTVETSCESGATCETEAEQRPADGSRHESTGTAGNRERGSPHRHAGGSGTDETSGEWQPMESAPKDRNILLVREAHKDRPRSVTLGYWFEPDAREELVDDEQLQPPFWWSEDGGFTVYYPPLCWRELPPPPSSALKAGG